MKCFIRFLKTIYFRYFLKVKKGKCLFIPHHGICETDLASIINYKADNCLIFVRYLLKNNLCQDKEIVIVSTTVEKAAYEQQYCREHYPGVNIQIIPDISYLTRPYKTAWAEAEYIIVSQTHFPFKKKKGQQYIVLGYYPVPTKKDWFPPIKGTWAEHRLEYAKPVDKIMSGSLIYSQLDSSGFEIPFGKFVEIGRVRSDVLLAKEDVSYVRDYFKQQCRDYKFSKIILYPPTHRDYEESEFDIKRSILGFNIDKERFEKFLSERELLIVCKLHSRQNASVVEDDLPRGVVNFKGNKDFGLIELMKVSDMLMSDYSSAYIDYLLLNKPVIFNFYDYNKYDQTRGFSFHPFERICAGEFFTDEKSFYLAVDQTLANPDKYETKRNELIEYLITYRTNVCEKTYKEIFG